MHHLDQLRAGELSGLKRLQLACGLTEFPREIFSLADSLEILDLSGNQLSSLPEDLPRLHKLRIIFCSDNRFTELPTVLGACQKLTMIGFKANKIREVPAQSLPTHLRWLILTDNEIEALPPELGNCEQLQKLMLAGNRLRALPDTLARCKKLELLRIAANELTELPSWLLSMPRLSWLAYAGNPFTRTHERGALNDTPIETIDWENLTLKRKLGEGASGVIHHAHYRGGERGACNVAVKLFKGEVTSDGLPDCEMAACIKADTHPHLIPVLGKVSGHPEDTRGLVMPLIDGTFANLASPPSLESCTRDIYSDNTAFTPKFILKLAHGVALAAEHLHKQGIMHGDLYGHNILHDGKGQTLIGDFGAASFYIPNESRQTALLERLEVRAFGCLLEELVERATFNPSGDTLKIALSSIVTACFADNPANRPTFTEISQSLASLTR